MKQTKIHCGMCGQVFENRETFREHKWAGECGEDRGEWMLREFDRRSRLPFTERYPRIKLINTSRDTRQYE